MLLHIFISVRNTLIVGNFTYPDIGRYKITCRPVSQFLQYRASVDGMALIRMRNGRDWNLDPEVSILNFSCSVFSLSNADEGEEKCMQCFGGETQGKETT